MEFMDVFFSINFHTYYAWSAFPR